MPPPDAPKVQPPRKLWRALRRILARVRTTTGHDFSRYKRSTVLRRLRRRMHVRQAGEMGAYLALLREDEDEVRALLKDFLISVTNFFRDPEAFEALETQVIPQLFEARGRDEAVRVWVPGCATGEEAFSVAMLLCERAEALEAAPRLKVFATDVDEEALEHARKGCYPAAIAADVSPERLRRFFVREGESYRVREPLREVVLFARHNLLHDPPFSRLDLVSCRNLLIYLERDVQQDVFRLFHYALREGGFLFLGASETAEGARERFRPVDKSRRLYRRRPGPARLPVPPAAPSSSPSASGATTSRGSGARRSATCGAPPATSSTAGTAS